MVEIPQLPASPNPMARSSHRAPRTERRAHVDDDADDEAELDRLNTTLHRDTSRSAPRTPRRDRNAASQLEPPTVDAPRTPRTPRSTYTSRRYDTPERGTTRTSRSFLAGRERSPEPGTPRSFIRLEGHVRASLHIDPSHFTPDMSHVAYEVSRTPSSTKNGRRVVVVSEEPVEVEDSSPELANTRRSNNRGHQEPVTPTRSSRGAATVVTSQSLSYAETLQPTYHTPNRPAGVFGRIARECSPSPPPLPNPPMSPVALHDPGANAHPQERDVFYCPSPSLFGGSQPATEVASRNSRSPSVLAGGGLSPMPPRQRLQPANLSYTVPPPTPASYRGAPSVPTTPYTSRSLSPDIDRPEFWSNWTASTTRSQTVREYLVDRFGYESDPDDGVHRKKAWYVVIAGLGHTGVYDCWTRAAPLTQGVSKAVHRGCKSKAEALDRYYGALARDIHVPTSVVSEEFRELCKVAIAEMHTIISQPSKLNVQENGDG
ncbi:hypothetical protein BC629DRAFT_1444285 [Irpex lacteus]|nr:hypothetical protein BC629DRAFT_1444285 [Irpex lacteus]